MRERLDTINGNLIETLNKFAPKRVVRLRGEQFENTRIEAMKKKRDRQWKKYKKTGLDKYYFKSKELSKVLVKVIKRERKRVFRAKLNSHGAKGFWKTVGSIFKSVDKDEINLKVEGEVISDKAKIAQLFADFFEDKVNKLSAKSTCIEAKPHPGTNLVWIPFTPAEVELSIKASKNKRSSGPDEIPMCIVKDGMSSLVPVLTVLFNEMMESNWYPDEWKVAKVTPIFKKGDKKEVGNYRPVSNLSSLSKIFERCLLARFNQWYEDDASQHGFRQGHSTTTAALEVQHHVSSRLDNRKKVCMYTLDMSAAFDLLRPNILEPMLCNVPDKLRSMIMSFLRERKAYVDIDGQTSFLKSIALGVPQGSVLGPKLFCVYTQGLAMELIQDEDVSLVVYADDSYVICGAESIPDLKKKVLETMANHVDWLTNIGMVVNSGKTELIFFKNDAQVTLDFRGQQIVSRPSMRVLGVEFDAMLDWSSQVKNVKSSCNRMKPALRSLKRQLSKKELTQVVTSHYYSRLYYASEVWFHPMKRLLKSTLTPLHYYPLRLITNDFKRTLSNAQLSKLTGRASPFEINNFKVARTLISISNSSEPFVLFHELLSHAVIERRSEPRPWFLDMSRTRIGRQSFSNRVTAISKSLKFDWLGQIFTKDRLRVLLKKTFFALNKPQ
jgi:hypothetical protein